MVGGYTGGKQQTIAQQGKRRLGVTTTACSTREQALHPDQAHRRRLDTARSDDGLFKHGLHIQLTLIANVAIKGITPGRSRPHPRCATCSPSHLQQQLSKQVSLVTAQLRSCTTLACLVISYRHIVTAKLSTRVSNRHARPASLAYMTTKHLLQVGFEAGLHS